MLFCSIIDTEKIKGKKGVKIIKFNQFDVDGTVFCSPDGRFWVSFDFPKNRWKVEEPENKIHGYFLSKAGAFVYVEKLIEMGYDNVKLSELSDS